MYEAYNRIFERCGLEFRAVLADTGNIGGSFSHEFMVLAETGEDVVMSCDKCDYAANLELAEIKQQDDKGLDNSENHKDIQEVHTPNLKTVEEVAEFLKVKSGDLIKTMIVEADGEPVAALVSGDKELSITKLRRHLGADLVELASIETIEKVTDGSVGFSGPVGLKIKIVADHSIKEIQNGVTGANKKDYHLVNVNLDKDYKVNEFADIRVAADGDPCRGCDGGKLKSTRGIEVGHVFKLGTKYSEAMSANFVDEDGRQKPFIMGCYGIGIGRTVAAAIEQNFDDNGMILPRALAPFEISVLPLNMKDENVIKVADEIYNSLLEKGYDVLIDDRKESAGFKFKDADLIGVPVHVRIGPKTLKENSVEIRLRKSGETRLVKVDDAVSEVVSIIHSGMV
jgi:prolyl-tRNA synthetase